MKTIAIVVYEGVEILDTTGVIEVFDLVNRGLREQGDNNPAYNIRLLASQAGAFTTSCGKQLIADAGWYDDHGQIDTLVVVGSPDEYLNQALSDRRLLDWLQQSAPKSRRIVSICTGAFLLAEAGLLDGKRVTTHWLDIERLRREYPLLKVESDAIYVRDGAVVTSAGVTSGMDLALSLIEEDCGRKVALAIARRMVLYLRRPGGQTQFSAQLQAQMATEGQFAPLLTWLEENASQQLSVDDLADRAAMSPRNFARLFVKETGMTPAKYLEQLCVQRAIRLLEETDCQMETVASKSGFASAELLRRVFRRRMGITPTDYRQRF